MLDDIQKLLVLQDRDRKILKLKEELARIPVERQELNARISQAQTGLDAAKNQARHLESERKKLELDVEARKQLIEKYSLQQFQTKKNEEYKALSHEIDTCKEAIVKLDDQQLALMEQIESAQRQVSAATQATQESKRSIDSRLADMAAREQNLQKELAEVEANRNELAAGVDDGARSRYERLMKQKGSSVIVGIQHGVCGGCHMQLNRQVVVSCQADQEVVTCPNCGRILYYTRDMDLAVAD